MKITKHNYEEYALDFVEGNLDDSTYKSMLTFLDRNPEINQEIEGIRDIILSPDEEIRYEAKSELLKKEPQYGLPIIVGLILLIGTLTIYYNSETNQKSDIIENVEQLTPKLIEYDKNDNVIRDSETQVKKESEDKTITKMAEINSIDNVDRVEATEQKENRIVTDQKYALNTNKDIIKVNITDDKPEMDMVIIKERNTIHSVNTIEISTLDMSNDNDLTVPKINSSQDLNLYVGNKSINVTSLTKDLEAIINEGKKKGLLSESLEINKIDLSSFASAITPLSFRDESF